MRRTTRSFGALLGMGIPLLQPSHCHRRHGGSPATCAHPDAPCAMVLRQRHTRQTDYLDEARPPAGATSYPAGSSAPAPAKRAAGDIPAGEGARQCAQAGKPSTKARNSIPVKPSRTVWWGHKLHMCVWWGPVCLVGTAAAGVGNREVIAAGGHRRLRTGLRERLAELQQLLAICCPCGEHAGPRGPGSCGLLLYEGMQGVPRFATSWTQASRVHG